jgi:hypothetical protein
VAALRTYLVECYDPGIDDVAVATSGARARVACAETGAADDPVEYLGALFVAEDEVVFHVFKACDAQTVRAASSRAGLRFERVVESVTIPSLAGSATLRAADKLAGHERP